jgi:hypothetical protein
MVYFNKGDIRKICEEIEDSVDLTTSVPVSVFRNDILIGIVDRNVLSRIFVGIYFGHSRPVWSSQVNLWIWDAISMKRKFKGFIIREATKEDFRIMKIKILLDENVRG